MVRQEPAFDDAQHDAIASELTGSQKASWACADDEDLVPIGDMFGHHQFSFISLSRLVFWKTRGDG